MFDFNIKILVVDDFLTMRKIVQRDLEELGFTTIKTAKNGAQAWEIFNEERIDLVISDWNMPEMTGLELLSKIRGSDKPHTPFIMVTAESEKAQREDAISEGVDAYLTKPFDSEDIEQAVDMAMNQSQQKAKAS